MTTIWRTSYRGADDKGVCLDHDTQAEAERYAEGLFAARVVGDRGLVYVYAVDVEDAA